MSERTPCPIPRCLAWCEFPAAPEAPTPVDPGRSPPPARKPSAFRQMALLAALMGLSVPPPPREPRS